MDKRIKRFLFYEYLMANLNNLSKLSSFDVDSRCLQTHQRTKFNINYNINVFRYHHSSSCQLKLNLKKLLSLSALMCVQFFNYTNIFAVHTTSSGVRQINKILEEILHNKWLYGDIIYSFNSWHSSKSLFLWLTPKETVCTAKNLYDWRIAHSKKQFVEMNFITNSTEKFTVQCLTNNF